MHAPPPSAAAPSTEAATSHPAQVVVVGSLNMDIVLGLHRMPAAGETVMAHDLQSLPGGKGGNQALACARHGADVTLFACVGRDHQGNAMRLALFGEGVNVEHVGVQEGVPTGTAVVMVEPDGQNRICVVAGANAALALKDEALLPELQGADFVLLQLELPEPVVLHALTAARKVGCRVVLNPSPAREVPAAWWPLLHTVVVNEHEAALLSGMPVTEPHSALAAAQALQARGAAQVVVTLGAQGAVAAWGDAASVQTGVFAALEVPVVDTTAAGDTFLGTMVTRLAEGCPLPDAVQWGICAASLCIGKVGAQTSIPHRAQVQEWAAQPVD